MDKNQDLIKRINILESEIKKLKKISEQTNEQTYKVSDDDIISHNVTFKRKVTFKGKVYFKAAVYNAAGTKVIN